MIDRITPAEIRRESTAKLTALGFRFAEWLPLPDTDSNLRPVQEIAQRLMALTALFVWVFEPEDPESSENIRAYIDRNQLEDAFAERDRDIWRLPRSVAIQEYGCLIGWLTENMLPLAWILGFDGEPSIEAAFIDDDIFDEMVFSFVPNTDGTLSDLLDRVSLRSIDDIRRKEDLFYCAHNAVRSAQLGDASSVPPDFDPIGHGGVVLERRQSLVWCLSPGVAWDDVEMGT